MHVISRKKINEFIELYPEVKSNLASWYKTMRVKDYLSFTEIRSDFPSADKVGKLTVFIIGGNKVRLIAAIHYNRKSIYIRAVLTHSQYDQNKWKE